MISDFRLVANEGTAGKRGRGLRAGFLNNRCLTKPWTMSNNFDGLIGKAVKHIPPNCRIAQVNKRLPHLTGQSLQKVH